MSGWHGTYRPGSLRETGRGRRRRKRQVGGAPAEKVRGRYVGNFALALPRPRAA